MRNLFHRPKAVQDDYQVFVSRKGDSYTLFIRELYLSVSGPNLEVAYEDLQTEKKRAINRMTANGLASSIPVPVASWQPSRPPRVFLPFFIKLGVVGLIAGMLVATQYDTIRASLEIIKRPKVQWVHDVAFKLENKWRNIPLERKEQIKEASDHLSAALAPYLDELFSSWVNILNQGRHIPALKKTEEISSQRLSE